MAYSDYHRKVYLAPVPYLINHKIYDYDIKHANLSIFYAKGMITEQDYNIISSFDRDQREVYFGLLQKDKEISDMYGNALSEYREKFIINNNIDDSHLLAVKNDAICTIDLPCSITRFDNDVEFVLKNVYSSYYHIGKLEIYYHLDAINNVEKIDIKGINDNKLEYHKDYMIEFLCSVFESIQTRLPEETLQYIIAFHDRYVNRELDLGYYRELNSDSGFRLSTPSGNQFLMNTWDKSDISALNIIVNDRIILELYAIVSNIYFNKKTPRTFI